MQAMRAFHDSQANKAFCDAVQRGLRETGIHIVLISGRTTTTFALPS